MKTTYTAQEKEAELSDKSFSAYESLDPSFGYFAIEYLQTYDWTFEDDYDEYRWQEITQKKTQPCD